MMITSAPSGDIARDPSSYDGTYQPRHAPWGAVRRWVRRHTTDWTGTCPHCGRELAASAQYVLAADCTLIRYGSGSYGAPGYQLDTPPDWARICGGACRTQPPHHQQREHAMTMNTYEHATTQAPAVVRGEVVSSTHQVGALAVHPGQHDWTPEQRAALRHMGIENAPVADQRIFLHQVQRTGLDPFAGQIHMVGRRDRDRGRTVWTIQTSIDGFRLIAERTGLYAGQTEPQWCGPDGQWVDVWVHSTPPVAARIGVYRKDWAHPVYAVAKFSEYAVHKAGGGLGPFWRRMPSHMIAKVAEALALRKAFPQDLSGLYTTDEMDRANAPATAPEGEQAAEVDWAAEVRRVERIADVAQRYAEAGQLYRRVVAAHRAGQCPADVVHDVNRLGEQAAQDAKAAQDAQAAEGVEAVDAEVVDEQPTPEGESGAEASAGEGSDGIPGEWQGLIAEALAKETARERCKALRALRGVAVRAARAGRCPDAVVHEIDAVGAEVAAELAAEVKQAEEEAVVGY